MRTKLPFAIQQHVDMKGELLPLAAVANLMGPHCGSGPPTGSYKAVSFCTMVDRVEPFEAFALLAEAGRKHQCPQA